MAAMSLFMADKLDTLKKFNTKTTGNRGNHILDNREDNTPIFVTFFTHNKLNFEINKKG